MFSDEKYETITDDVVDDGMKLDASSTFQFENCIDFTELENRLVEQISKNVEHILNTKLNALKTQFQKKLDNFEKSINAKIVYHDQVQNARNVGTRKNSKSKMLSDYKPPLNIATEKELNKFNSALDNESEMEKATNYFALHCTEGKKLSRINNNLLKSLLILLLKKEFRMSMNFSGDSKNKTVNRYIGIRHYPNILILMQNVVKNRNPCHQITQPDIKKALIIIFKREKENMKNLKKK